MGYLPQLSLPIRTTQVPKRSEERGVDELAPLTDRSAPSDLRNAKHVKASQDVKAFQDSLNELRRQSSFDAFTC